MSRSKNAIDKSLLRIVTGMVLQMRRESKGLTQDQIARSMNIQRTSVVNIEKGTQGTPLHIFMSFAKALDIKPSKLMEGIEALMHFQKYHP